MYLADRESSVHFSIFPCLRGRSLTPDFGAYAQNTRLELYFLFQELCCSSMHILLNNMRSA